MNYGIGLPATGALGGAAATATAHALWPGLPVLAYVAIGLGTFAVGLAFTVRQLRARGRFGA
ncbi:MAG TPA: hypothetical protein VFD01_22995 [Candidatus Dormibacteraeota bacterium]|jgi:hypothetical protein|nr:hypothetical protein [Candidatus Dormibacteraeota bacterium]